MNMVARLPRRQLTVAEFLEWCPEDGRRWQLVDGRPRAMAPGKRTHGALQAEIGALLRNHLLASGSMGSVETEPGIGPAVNAARNMRIPDLAVTYTPFTEEEQALNEPVPIVEILSMSNERQARNGGGLRTPRCWPAAISCWTAPGSGCRSRRCTGRRGSGRDKGVR